MQTNRTIYPTISQKIDADEEEMLHAITSTRQMQPFTSSERR